LTVYHSMITQNLSETTMQDAVINAEIRRKIDSAYCYSCGTCPLGPVASSLCHDCVFRTFM